MLCVVCVAWVLVSRFQSGVSCVGVGFKVWFGPPFRPSPGPPFPWTAQNFAFFFFTSTAAKFVLFLPSLGVFSLNFGGVFKGRDPQMCTFGLSKRAHLSAPALQTPPKFHEKTPREGRKERILWREREKKREILGFPPFGAPPFGPPPFRPPTFSVFGPPPFGASTLPAGPEGPATLLFLGLGPWPA